MRYYLLDNLTTEQHENVVNWIKELRSGNYQQGTGFLRSNNRYCCLGVGCAMLGIENREEVRESGTIVTVFGEKSAVLPEEEHTIRLGLKTNTGKVYHSNPNGKIYSSLANLNDRGLSFRAIADLLENDLNEKLTDEVYDELTKQAGTLYADNN